MSTYVGYFSLNITNSNANYKGGRTASQEVDYLENGNKKNNKNDNNETEKQLEQEADKRLGDIDDSSSTADDKIEYIENSKGRRREDLAYFKSANIPEWANQEAILNKTTPHFEFFRASEKYEEIGKKKRNVTYREIKLALPNDLLNNNELNLPEAEQNQLLLERQVKIVDKFVKLANIENLTYTYAIHSKTAQLDFINQSKNTHVHLMWSDRIPDRIERDKEQYFKRYKPVNTEQGGCKKDRTYSDSERKHHLKNTLRIGAEKIINNAYKQYGIDKFVCCGNKKDIYEKCLRMGDHAAAEIAATVPAQKHTGEKAAVKTNHPRTIDTMQKKAAAQAIRDKHILKNYECAEQGLQPLEYKQLANNIADLQKELAKIENRMNQIENLYFANMDFEVKDKLETDVQKTINSIQAEVIINEQRLAGTSDQHLYAVRKICYDNDLKSEFASYRNNYYQISKSQRLIDGIEKQIINKHFKKNDTASNIILNEPTKSDKIDFDFEKYCSPRQLEVVQSARRDIERFEQQIAKFEYQHIKSHQDEFTKYKKQADDKSRGLQSKINELRHELLEIKNANPEIQEIYSKHRNLATQIRAIDRQLKVKDITSEVKKKLYEQRKPLFEEYKPLHEKLQQIYGTEVIALNQTLKSNPTKFDHSTTKTVTPDQSLTPKENASQGLTKTIVNKNSDQSITENPELRRLLNQREITQKCVDEATINFMKQKYEDEVKELDVKIEKLKSQSSTPHPTPVESIQKTNTKTTISTPQLETQPQPEPQLPRSDIEKMIKELSSLRNRNSIADTNLTNLTIELKTIQDQQHQIKENPDYKHILAISNLSGVEPEIIKQQQEKLTIAEKEHAQNSKLLEQKPGKAKMFFADDATKKYWQDVENKYSESVENLKTTQMNYDGTLSKINKLDSVRIPKIDEEVARLPEKLKTKYQEVYNKTTEAALIIQNQNTQIQSLESKIIQELQKDQLTIDRNRPNSKTFTAADMVKIANNEIFKLTHQLKNTTDSKVKNSFEQEISRFEKIRDRAEKQAKWDERQVERGKTKTKTAIKYRASGPAGSNSPPSDRNALLNFIAAITDRNSHAVALIARIDDSDEKDLSAMTPEQIETYLAQKAIERSQ